MFKITNESNYLAKMVILKNPIKHPKADRLQGWIIDGNKIWTDLSHQSGDKVVFFPIECSINPKILSELSLFDKSELNKDKEKKGYINERGRVRAIRLRGEPSEGLVIPFIIMVETLNSFGYKVSENDFVENKEFDSVGDFIINQKYVVNIVKQKGENKDPKQKNNLPKENIIVDGQFHLHNSTSHLGKNLHQIQSETIISITEKLHGTSFVVGNILTKKKLSWKDKIAKWFGVNVQNTEYGIIYSSRSVIKNKNRNAQQNPNDLWTIVKNEISDKISKGITIYGEIVGFNTNGTAIQKKYDYGCDPNTKEHKVYVYRITYTNVDGKIVEFTMQQIKEYCEKYSLNVVPIHFYGTAKEFLDNLVWEEDKFFEKVKKMYCEKFCSMCVNKVPNEGVVIKIDSTFENKVFKCKSFAFVEQETALLDAGESDTESEN